MDRRTFIKLVAIPLVKSAFPCAPQPTPQTILGLPVVFTEFPDAPKEVAFGSFSDWSRHEMTSNCDAVFLVPECFTEDLRIMQQLIEIPEDQWENNPTVTELLEKLKSPK